MNTDINFTVKATYADAQRAFEMVEKSVLDVSETIEGMTKKATQLRTALNQSKQGSEAFQFLSKELGKTETQLANATIEVQRYKNEVQNMAEINRRAGMVGLSFNRIIQDAGYFGQSAAMGFMAVGNNITYFAEQLSFAKREGLAMSSVLKGMLGGVNAWMFVINLAVSAITFFTVSQRSAKSSIDSTTGSITKQKEELDRLRRKYDEFEQKAKDPAVFMKAVARGELQKLEETKKALQSQIEAFSSIKGGTDAEKFARSILVTELNRQLGVTNEKLDVINASWRNIVEDANKGFDKLTKTSEKHKATIGFISVLYSNILSSMEAMSRLNPLREAGRGLQFQGQVAVPEKPVIMTLAEEQQLLARNYKTLIADFSRMGSNLRSIFRDAGDTFLGKMIEALNTVAAILELVETIKSIMTALDLISIAAKVATAPMTGGASLIPVGVGAPDFSRQSSPTQIMIPVYIGEEKIQTIIVDTTKRAQRLRYL